MMKMKMLAAVMLVGMCVLWTTRSGAEECAAQAGQETRPAQHSAGNEKGRPIDRRAPPPERWVKYTCRLCGLMTLYPKESEEGELAKSVSGLEKMFEALPYKMRLNAAEMCRRRCSKKGGEHRLEVKVTCCDCGREFVWYIKNTKDVSDAALLNTCVPVKRNGRWDIMTQVTGDGQKPVSADDARYVRTHVFCPGCALSH